MGAGRSVRSDSNAPFRPRGYDGGVPQRLAYDNLKSAVIQVGRDSDRRLNKRFRELFEEEKRCLLPLPEHPFPARRKTVAGRRQRSKVPLRHERRQEILGELGDS